MRNTTSTKTSSERWPTLDEALLLDRLSVAIAGVTGSSGKTVTADLLARMLQAAGYRVTAGIDAAIGRADKLGSRDRIVLTLPTTRPGEGAAVIDVLAVTGLAPDELGEGSSLSAASTALHTAMRSARRSVVVNADDPRVLALAAATPVTVRTAGLRGGRGHVTLHNGHLMVESSGVTHRLATPAGTPFVNPALATDLVVATAAALALGAEVDHVRAAVRGYDGPPAGHHELLGVSGGVRWVDDSAATRPGRTAATLSGYAEPVVLIAGGRSVVGQPLSRWVHAVVEHCPHVLLFGPAARDLAAALRAARVTERIVRCADLDDAVTIVPRLIERGDTVLFSPGCEAERVRGAARFRDLATTARRRREAA